MGATTYNTLTGANWSQSEQELQEERTRENQQTALRFQQIRNANSNIQGVLQRRMQYLNPSYQLDSRMNPRRVPHSKLKVKNIPFSLQRHSVNVSADFSDMDFICDIERQQVLKPHYRFFVKVEMLALKKNQVSTDDLTSLDDALYNKVLENSLQNHNLNFENMSKGTNSNGEAQPPFHNVQQIIDLWLGDSPAQAPNFNSQGVKQLVKKVIEIDERSAGAVTDQAANYGDTTQSFPVNIRQSVAERINIETTVKNQGLFNYGERPTLFVVVHLLSLKFDKMKRMQASLQTDVCNSTPSGPEDSLQIMSGSNNPESLLKLKSHKKLITICQLEVNFESQKKNSKPEVQSVKVIDSRQKLIIGSQPKNNRGHRDMQNNHKGTNGENGRDQSARNNHQKKSNPNKQKLHHFDVNEVFRIDPTTYSNEPFVKKPENESSKKSKDHQISSETPNVPEVKDEEKKLNQEEEGDQEQSSQGKNLQNQLSTLKQQQQEDAIQCIICFSQPKSTILLPCRHFCMCQACAQGIKDYSRGKCPICRQVVTRYVEVE